MDDRLMSLYRQRIENSRYVLYEFAFDGPYAFSSFYAGVTVLDSTKRFSANEIEYELPGSYFSALPKLNDLRLVDIDHNHTSQEKDTLLKPKRQYISKANDLQFNVVEYLPTYGSATMNTGLMQYTFDDFKETKDSLTFYNVIKTFGGKVFKPTVSFLKGNIKVIDSADNSLAYIEVKQLVVERGNIYKPTSPLDLVPNQPIVGFASYRFYPRRPISSKSLSEFGIWKQVKKSQNKLEWLVLQDLTSLGNSELIRTKMLWQKHSVTLNTLSQKWTTWLKIVKEKPRIC